MAASELADSRPPIPTDGLSLAALRAFCAQHAGCTFPVDGVALPFAALTTAQVCLLIVKPASLARDCAYAQLLGSAADADGRPLVGCATHFVSHAWSCRFADLLAALEAHASKHEGLQQSAYLWVDIFTVNQHRSLAVDQAWWADAFRCAVGAMGHTLLVLEPWHAPAPLTRSWCLWELLCTLDGGAQLDCVLSPAQSDAFQAALMDCSVDIMVPVAKIDARSAEAFKPEDKEMIQRAVEASAGGFGAVNGRVFDRLRAWLLAEARALATRVRAECGDDHADTLLAVNRLASLLGAMDLRDEAATLLAGVLRARRTALGDAHALTLASVHALAVELGCLARRKEAKPFFLEALTGRRALLGDAHADTLATMNVYACLLRSDAEHMSRLMRPERDAARAEAGQLFRAALAGRRALLGDDHLSTLTSQDDLGILLRHQGGAAEEAEFLFRAALAGRRIALGERHPLTLQSLNGLATLLQDTGRESEAEALQLQAVQIRRETLGDRHKGTLDAAYNYACAIEAQGLKQRGAGALSAAERVAKLQAAHDVFQRVLDGYKATLQERDHDIGDCARRVYLCTVAMGHAAAETQRASRRSDANESEEEDEAEGWVTDDSASPL